MPALPLESAICRWSQHQPGVLAVIVVGSRARPSPPPDAHSDLDLILFLADPQAYAQDRGWLDSFREIWLARLDRTGRGDPEWVVLYAGGIKVDFVLCAPPPTAPPLLQNWLRLSPYAPVLARGARVLFDRTASLPPDPAEILFAVPSPATTLPSEEAFLALIDAALLAALQAARFCVRSDLWRAHHALACALRPRLLTLLEWHAQAQPGPTPDTWYEGRFLNQWGDPQALASLANLFPAYSHDGMRHALLAALDTLHRLAGETARRLGVPYPSPGQAQSFAWIRSLLEG